jgi:integrase
VSIQKRVLPSGKISWRLDYRDNQGTRRAKAFPTQKAAIDYETTVRDQLRSGTHVADSASVTLEQAATLWLEKCRLDGLESSTLKQYTEHCVRHLLPAIGNKTKLSKLTRPAIVDFRNQLSKTHSQAMMRKLMISLKSLLGNACESGLVAQNNATGVKVKMAAARHVKKVAIPEKDEIRAILATANEWPIKEVGRALVIVALFSGLRSSELRGLVWSCVDLENKVIRVRQRADYRGKMGSPKSAAGNRDVPLTPMALNTLRQWRLVCPKTEAGLVFPTSRGGVITHSGMHRIWHSLLEAAGVQSYRFHDLRHTAASLFIEHNKWQPKKVMQVMGHASIQMTFGLYGHLWATPESDQEAMAQLEANLLRH